jgi:hypothetical protein
METYESEKNRFLRFLAEYNAELEREAASLAGRQKDDEAVFARIRLNVADILEKMFRLSVHNVENSITNPAMLAAVNAGDTKPEQLKAGYLALCGTITEPWKQHLLKSREHGDAAKAMIEEIKLETAEKIIRAFVGIMEKGERGNGY